MDLRETPAAAVNRHPWELARVTALRAIAGEYALLSPGARVLDLGCGDGFLIDALCPESTGPIDALDIHLTAEQLAAFATARPRLNFHNSDQTLIGTPYGLITMFDVVEHVEDDTGFLRQTIARFAAPGTRLFCTVPAFDSLFCSHDTFLKHHRRYRLAALRQLLDAAGLHVLASGYLFGLLLPVRILTLMAEKCLSPPATGQGIGNWRHDRFLTAVIQAMLQADNRVLFWLSQKGITLPGLTVWAVCEIPR